jgi:hypothetical protein
MTQELLLMWFFGFFCGLLVISAVGAVNLEMFWARVFDAYYWLKDKVRR